MRDFGCILLQTMIQEGYWRKDMQGDCGKRWDSATYAPFQVKARSAERAPGTPKKMLDLTKPGLDKVCYRLV